MEDVRLCEDDPAQDPDVSSRAEVVVQVRCVYF